VCIVTYGNEKSRRPRCACRYLNTFEPLSYANNKITIHYYEQVGCHCICPDFWPEAVYTDSCTHLYLPFLFWYTFYCIRDILPDYMSCTEIKFLANCSSKLFWIAWTIFMSKHGHYFVYKKKGQPININDNLFSPACTIHKHVEHNFRAYNMKISRLLLND